MVGGRETRLGEMRSRSMHTVDLSITANLHTWTYAIKITVMDTVMF